MSGRVDLRAVSAVRAVRGAASTPFEEFGSGIGVSEWGSSDSLRSSIYALWPVSSTGVLITGHVPEGPPAMALLPGRVQFSTGSLGGRTVCAVNCW